MIELLDPVIRLPGIGPTVAQDLKKIGIETVQDLLFYFPFRYDDLSKVCSISELVPGEVATIQGRVSTIKSRRSPRKRMMLTEGVIEDKTGRIKAIWFNQPYLAKSLRPGTVVSLSGQVDDKYGLAMVNPMYEVIRSKPPLSPPLGRGESHTLHTGRIVPVYSLTGSLSQKRLRAAIHYALEAVSQIEDWLPEQIVEEEQLPDIATAIMQIHYPEDWPRCEQAIDRNKFDELFLHQLMFARSRAEVTRRPAYSIERDQDPENEFVASFPFELTKAQKRSVEEIISDMTKPHPMNRLLEGDVGSGKSAVAAAAIEACLRSGHQAAYLAPTEILAKQQFDELSGLLSGHSVALLTRTDIIVSPPFSTPRQARGALTIRQAHGHPERSRRVSPSKGKGGLKGGSGQKDELHAEPPPTGCLKTNQSYPH